MMAVGRPATGRRPVGTERPVVTIGTDDTDPDVLGGKGAALSNLVAAGYPIPPTGVVTIAGYRAVAAHPTIRGLVARVGAADEPVPEDEVDAAFASVPIDDDLAAAIVEVARGVGGPTGAIAVRSSATVEDLHGSSFAGQYRSLLDVDTNDDAAVLTAVRAVWASLWHPAPAAYRRAFAIDEDDVAMAVVLMAMVPATSAGVVFTADPGGSDGARVEAVEGLGEALVSGQTTPSAWVVPRPTGSERPDLPAAPARALELALDIERHVGTPQDIEWAAVGDDVAIVQARPITVLDDQDGFDSPIDDHELTTAGIVEMVPGVLPALRWEINRLLLDEAFRSILDSLGLIRGTEAEERAFVRRVRGRAAIDFDQLREMAADLPGAVAELERQYFGQADTTTDTATEVTDPPPTTPLARFTRSVGRLSQDLRTLRTRRQVIEQAEILILATDALSSRKPDLTSTSDAELLAYLRRLVDLAARGLAAELGVAAAGAAAYQRLQAQLSTHLGPEEGTAATQRVTAGGGLTVERHHHASAAIFAGPTWDDLGTVPVTPAGDLHHLADERWPELRDRLRALPGWTRRRILTGGFVDVRLRLVHHLVVDVIEQLRRREAAKAAFLELGGEVRRVTRELGARLVARGAIEHPDDIELLTSAEITAALGAGTGAGGDAVKPVAPDTIRRRRNWLSRYEAEGALPVRFTGVPDREPEPLPSGDVLEGWAAGPGRRQGRARVVETATGRIDRGEILVAETTDASWSPLFLRAGAVVVERGGPLSHAAILARELGLPAVLNVASASRVLDGRLVTVDGDRGKVVIEPDPEAPG